MDWMRYLAPEWWQMEKINQIDQQLRSLRRQESQVRADASTEIDDLASDLGKAMLLVHSLIELCVRKGVMTRAEIAAVINELDLRDGVADGRLGPPRHKSVRPPNVHEFLGQLSQGSSE